MKLPLRISPPKWAVMGSSLPMLQDIGNYATSTAGCFGLRFFRGVGGKCAVISSDEAAWLLGEVKNGHAATLGWKVQCQ